MSTSDPEPNRSEPQQNADSVDSRDEEPSLKPATYLDPGWVDLALRNEVSRAFTNQPKRLSPRWLYDEKGSELFDQITELAEYYPTEAERSLLHLCATEIASAVQVGTVVELGSGTSDKTRTLLDAFQAKSKLRRFVPFDVSETMLVLAADLLHQRYPGVSILPVVGDFNLHLHHLPDDDPRLVAFLGGTIGNFYPDERKTFLDSLSGVLEPGEWFLLGADLVKDPDRILAAYNDDQGITAEFILNVLNVINRELDGNIPVDEFEYVPLWDAEAERVDMRVKAKSGVKAKIEAINLEVDFDKGEELLVEISSKFRPSRLCDELAAANMPVKHSWVADGDEFGLFLAQRI